MRGLAQTLVLTGAVRAADMSAAMAEAGEGPELQELLVSSKLVTEAQVAEAIALHTGHRYVDLANIPLDPNVVALVPGTLCRRYGLIPVDRRGDRLTVGVLDPTDIVALDDVASITDLFVEPVVVAQDALTQMFERFLRSDEVLSELSMTIEDQAESSQAAFTETLEEQDNDAPIVRFVNLLIAQAINDRASDIHVEPGEKQLTVRFRIDGVLHEMQKADRAIQDGIISRLKIMSSIDIAERRVPQDGRVSVTVSGKQVDLRVATLPTVFGEKIVMRILDKSNALLRLSDLGFLPDTMTRFEQSYRKPYGTILVTGPTGSGKSTTLYATLNILNEESKNIITVEDPVEYRLPGINQVQVNNKAGLTFAGALRSILRSDPDIVLVGEIRDKETATIAIEAALTGHLVLSTLHTNDAATTPTRLVEMGVEPFLVASALDCIVAQRLARRLCDRCKTGYRPDVGELTSAGWDTSGLDEVPEIFKPVGCGVCSQTGYYGRFAIHEVMNVSEEVERMIVEREHSEDMKKMAVAQGMLPLREVGLQQVRNGLTSIEEILRVVA
jgi:type IV pilus assembly protein PilB